MTQIGETLGKKITGFIRNNRANLYLICTIHDADFLAKQILSYLENHFTSIRFACFWNKKIYPAGIASMEVTPILRKYQEPILQNTDYLITIGSDMSEMCMMRTNILNLLQTVSPHKILIVLPVISHTVEDKFRNEFKKEIQDRFKFIYLTRNNGSTPDTQSRYRIGSADRYDNNHPYVPEIVKNRRSRWVSSETHI